MLTLTWIFQLLLGGGTDTVKPPVLYPTLIVITTIDGPNPLPPGAERGMASAAN